MNSTWPKPILFSFCQHKHTQKSGNTHNHDCLNATRKSGYQSRRTESLPNPELKRIFTCIISAAYTDIRLTLTLIMTLAVCTAGSITLCCSSTRRVITVSSGCGLRSRVCWLLSGITHITVVGCWLCCNYITHWAGSISAVSTAVCWLYLDGLILRGNSHSYNLANSQTTQWIEADK